MQSRSCFQSFDLVINSLVSRVIRAGRHPPRPGQACGERPAEGGRGEVSSLGSSCVSAAGRPRPQPRHSGRPSGRQEAARACYSRGRPAPRASAPRALTCGVQVIPETRETKSCWSDAGSLRDLFVSRGGFGGTAESLTASAIYAVSPGARDPVSYRPHHPILRMSALSLVPQRSLKCAVQKVGLEMGLDRPGVRGPRRPPLGARDSQPAPPSLAGVTVPGQGPLRPHPFHGGTSGCGCAQKRCRIIRGRVLAVGMRQQFVPVCC